MLASWPGSLLMLRDEEVCGRCKKAGKAVCAAAHSRMAGSLGGLEHGIEHRMGKVNPDLDPSSQ